MSTADTPKPHGNGTSRRTKTGSNGHGAKPVRDEGLDQIHRRELLAGLRAFKRGNFETKLRDDMTGLDGEIAECFNELVAMVKAIKDEAHDVCTAVGKEGQAAKRMRRLRTTGGWSDYIALRQKYLLQFREAERLPV